MSLELLHPLTARWFAAKFGAPTEPQKLGWPVIARREHTLIAAPTGSGKTLTAFMICIDRLVQEAIAGRLTSSCKVLYVSPLKALASDVRKNLEIPLLEIHNLLAEEGHGTFKIRSAVRTGDTTSSERQAILRRPPHILVTTPESLYLLLTSERGREILRPVETVIVDEIHALARDKRGSHLTLSLERLKLLTDKEPTLIGLSATQKPVEDIAGFLVGMDTQTKKPKPCTVIDIGHSRALDLDVVVPASPLGTVCSNEQWDELYKILADHIASHRSTLIFVNTRRLAERLAYRLAEIMGEEAVLCHHGSLSKTRRLTAETRLKNGELKAIVATASLELGIDIGYIDLVCQIGIPYSIATFLQRIGRSGHAIKATPKGRLLPLTRDELIEAMALMRAVRDRHLDRIEIPRAPLDILTQQLIAECASRKSDDTWNTDDAYEMVLKAWPYQHLTRESFLATIHMTAEGFTSGKRRFAYLIWDRQKNRLSARSGARLAALTSGGAIPETGDYRVILDDDGTFVGTVTEDFAIESMAGDIFVLGTQSWQVRHVRGGEVVVRDAHGQPPTIPFWEGEAPGRTQEFSIAVAELRSAISEKITADTLAKSEYLKLEALPQIRELQYSPFEDVCQWLQKICGVQEKWPILQAVHYIAVAKSALGIIPSRQHIVFERFFDEMGGMQLVIHSSYGSRLNRGWGLALRKRFCRNFDFELQASADDDGIVLSLGPQHGFPLEQLFTMLSAENVEHFLTQALLAAPMFGARWRWNATRALAVLRASGGKRIAPALQRFRSEDLLTAVFPAQTACQENHGGGDIEIPDHPLVQQTVHDCLTEAMDVVALQKLLGEIKSGQVTLIAKDTREPSPFAYQLLSGYPYSFLDDAALEDRRTRAVPMRPALSASDLQDLDRFNPDAIATVQRDAWPNPTTADELYELLVQVGAFPLHHMANFHDLFTKLVQEERAAVAKVQLHEQTHSFAVALESVLLMEAAFPLATGLEKLARPEWLPPAPSAEEARQKILQGWLEISGPISEASLQKLFPIDHLNMYLAAIETTGAVLRCRMDATSPDYSHWCSRGLLRRIHRLTVETLREQIRPVSPEDYLHFLFDRHGLLRKSHTKKECDDSPEDTLLHVIATLQGYEAPAMAWESEIFPSRVLNYDNSLLDQLTGSGAVAFGRLTPKKPGRELQSGRAQGLTASMPLSFVLRRDFHWLAPLPKEIEETPPDPLTHLSSNAQIIFATLTKCGALFLDEITARARLLRTQVELALGELAAEGLATCDHFQALRSILSPLKKEKRKSLRSLPKHIVRKDGLLADMGGRWALLQKLPLDPAQEEERLEQWAWQLLNRYGILFRDLLARESLAPSWGQLIYVLRRLEARGEIRGGRFISGVSGEQFGLSEAHEKLLKLKQEDKSANYAVISSADPLNLTGIITKEEKIPPSHGTRILFVGGKVTAICRGYDIETKEKISEDMARDLRLMGMYRAHGA